MARPSRPRIVDSTDESDDSLPDLTALAAKKKKLAASKKPAPEATPKENGVEGNPTKAPATVRRRKLGPISDKGLLGGWKADGILGEVDAPVFKASEETKSRKPRVELRARKVTPAQATPPPEKDEKEEEDGPSGYLSAREEVTVIEEVTILDDGFDTAQSSASNFEDSLGDFIVDDSDSESYFAPSKLPPKTTSRERTGRPRQTKARAIVLDSDDEEEPVCKPSEGSRQPSGTSKGLAETFSRLQLNDPSLTFLPAPPKPIPPKKMPRSKEKEQTPPTTPPKDKPGLVSPTKLNRIPKTPHRASSDLFWNREFIDDWNDEHSPRKQLFPDPAKASPAKKPTSSPKKPAAPSARAAKKAFEDSKHALAASFLAELDTTITSGQLSQLTASTGGIKLNWTNKLNTTAGRASWKRESVTTRGSTAPPTHRHHASIELSTKVIDDEHRLLNVVAHEFCHLANYMVSGVVNNPHGKEFKAWAARCSAAFGASRGIEVTTKHTYDIDFKYVWQCEQCPLLYKRHSKSIDPARHRCGAALCKGVLKQIKPVPRGGGGGGEKGDGEDKVKKGPTEYQVFMKEEMKRVREENPGILQKEVMGIVASRWKEERERRAGSASRTATPGVEEVGKGVEVIALD
ncbi:SprT-like family-domain-containing protein [Podospora conica]|nr:SprT-like family-domain-containing protein [Schizothecium conicum]